MRYGYKFADYQCQVLRNKGVVVPKEEFIQIVNEKGDPKNNFDIGIWAQGGSAKKDDNEMQAMLVKPAGLFTGQYIVKEQKFKAKYDVAKLFGASSAAIKLMIRHKHSK